MLLANGVKIRPSTCRADECAIAYDGSSNIQMDQMVATFTLLENLMWSDGESLTSADSIYSYQLASDANTPVSKYVIDRTATYEAADDLTIQWWGLPGYIDPDYYTNFWMPLPQHAWAETSATDLQNLEASSHLPVGWGPYIIDEWKAGEYIHLVKNLNYFLASSGLPKFDELTFFFQPDADSAITSLINGNCDVLDPSVGLDCGAGHVNGGLGADVLGYCSGLHQRLRPKGSDRINGRSLGHARLSCCLSTKKLKT